MTEEKLSNLYALSTDDRAIFVGSDIRQLVGEIRRLKADRVVTIKLPEGYADAAEFAADCGFEVAGVANS